jgi:hypothetical protein
MIDVVVDDEKFQSPCMHTLIHDVKITSKKYIHLDLCFPALLAILTVR